MIAVQQQFSGRKYDFVRTTTSQNNKLPRTHRQRVCLFHQDEEEGCSRNSLVMERLEGLHLHHLFQGGIMGDCLYPLQYQAHTSGLHVT